MPGINNTNKNLIRFYLGYTSSAVPYGDKALLERALERTDYSVEELTEIGKQVERCTRTWEEIETAGDDIAYRRIIVGDVNRNDTEYRSDRPSARRRAFVYESDQLAITMGVRNYRNPANAIYLHYGIPNA